MVNNSQEILKEEIHGKLHEFTLATFPLARKKGITDDSFLLQSGIVDSLGILELVGFIEAQFGIVISDEDLAPENFQNLKVLTAFVMSKCSTSLDNRIPSLGVTP
jgi:acyl carrier protein